MALRSLIHGFWMCSIGIQVLLTGVVLAKKMWVRVPVFSAYVVFNLIGAIATYVAAKSTQDAMPYFYTYWICEAIGIVLGLAVVRELFMNLFSPHAGLRNLATMIFRVAVIVLLALAFGVIYAQSANARGITNGVLLAAEAARIVEVGLIMFLFLSSSAFGLHWRQNVFGIALGLGMFAAVELVTVTLIGHVNANTKQALGLVRGISFSSSLLIWLGYLLAPERAPNVGEVPKRAQLEQWNQAVTELISR
ncbi:MAG TPA: hypothetical protein VGJ33_09450 [Candidatus Angelobacter sp.]|jgi:hypothetical protein